MNNKEFHLLPTNRVVTAVDNKEIADKMEQALLNAGLEANDINVMHGEAAEEFLDLDGSRHGFFTKLLRKYQQLTGPESFMIAQAEAAIEYDRYIVSAKTDGDEEERQRAFEIMAPLTERTVYFCGQFTITILKVGKNYSRETEYEQTLVSESGE